MSPKKWFHHLGHRIKKSADSLKKITNKYVTDPTADLGDKIVHSAHQTGRDVREADKMGDLPDHKP